MKQKPFESYEQRLAQFKESERQKQAGEMQQKQAGVAKVVTQALYPDNPYLRARLDVLGKYSREHRAEILAYERTNNLNNRFYAEFCHDVAVLGDQYMPI